MGSQVQILGPLTVPAAVVTAVATQQAVAIWVINGTLASGGVASLTVPRRVTIVSAGNDSATTFTVRGTDRNGIVFSEALLGANIGTATTTHDFLTVTAVTSSVAAAGAGASIGTSNTASTAPMLLDQFPNPGMIAVRAVLNSGAATFSIEVSTDDYSPAWDLNTNAPNWFSNPVGLIGTGVPAAALFSGLSATNNGVINQPCSMIRLTVTAGQGSVSLYVLQALGIARY